MNKPENKQTEAPAPGKYGSGGFGGPRPKGAKDEKAKRAEEAKKATEKLAKEQADGGPE